MIAIIIPARYQSSRFPGKPLVLLKEKPLIWWTLQAAEKSTALLHEPCKIYVTTDDKYIADTVTSYGHSVILTPSTAKNGTERLAMAMEQLHNDISLYVNFQGDSPLCPPEALPLVIKALTQGAQVATPIIPFTAHSHTLFQEDRKKGVAGGTSVVVNRSGGALYFSKNLIPWQKDTAKYYFHLGLYGYTPTALQQYMAWPLGTLEKQEGLEQLRFLENGITIQTVLIEPTHPVWEVNLPEDIARIEPLLPPVL